MELKYYAGKDVLDALLDCMERISKQDGADVVEVVRCKDCVWYVESEAVCKFHSNNYEPPVYCTEVDYCSYGARKEDEG